MNLKIKSTALIVACTIALSLNVACGNKETNVSESEIANASSITSSVAGDTVDEIPDNEKPTTEFEEAKLDKYKYVWGDEFDKDVLDLSKWTVKMHSSASVDCLLFEMGDEELSNVFRIKDGLMTQNFIRWYDPTNSLIQYACSAHLMTRPTMSYQYGYLEVRLRMSFRKDGNSFWLSSSGALNANKNTYCNLEMDVFETKASTDSLIPNIHYWYSDGRHSDYNETRGYDAKYIFEESYNLANEFHIYGFEWTPTEMSLYVDGEKYWTLDTTKSFDDDPDISAYNQPMYLMLHGGAFTSGSTWHAYSGDEVDNSSLPLDYSVDYVRLYQDPDMKGTQLNLAQ